MDVPYCFTPSAPGVPHWNPRTSTTPRPPELPCCVRTPQAPAGDSAKAKKAERKPPDGGPPPMPQLTFRNMAALLYQNMLRHPRLKPGFGLKFPTPGPGLDSDGEEEEEGEEVEVEESAEELENLEEEAMAGEQEGA